MIKFILAGALGALSISVILLFRQLRSLSWQLTQIRVDRDSDKIMRALTNGETAPKPLSLLEERPRRRIDPYLGLCLLVGAAAISGALLLDSGTGTTAEDTTTADQVTVCEPT